jgi:hypothetical protein
MARRVMRSMPRLLRVAFILGIPLLGVLAFLWIGIPTKTKTSLEPGVTFSQTYAASINLNWREALTAVLDDLGVRRFRIPVYWSVVEPSRGNYDWSSIDFQMDEIARRNGTVLLAIGLKLPRWPECWMPEWAKTLPTDQEHAARLAYLTAAVERYKNHPALQAWQVENEARFPFGICPPPSHAFHQQEIAHVSTLDPSHEVVTTDAGEMSTWIPTGRLVERLGVSVYRVVRFPWGSIWTYDWIPPYWYARRAVLVKPWVKEVFVSEFQMEPWLEKGVLETDIETQKQTFDLDRMHKNFSFAERMRMSEIYFWGVEWWWWMKTQQGDPTFWDQAKEFFQHHQNSPTK